MSAILEWSPELELGLGGIDDQHRQLVELTNALRMCIGREELGRILDALAHHTETHFREEEQLMADSGFPGLAAHQANHRAFSRRVSDARRRHGAGEWVDISSMRLIQSWLVEHLERADREFGAFLVAETRPRGTIARLLRRLA
ncbi:MAG: hemerythrin family protein [Rhodocyclaceae bacterium]|nr:hemerythrin family protein [Rhodocyclaceae bacterium]